MSGRRPIPTALKVIRGNPGKRPLPEHEPQPALGGLACPDYMRGEALAEWNRIVPQLEQLGVATSADRTVLELYCVLTGEMRELAKAYRPQPPAMLSQLRACMVELGLTPASRAKLTVKARSEDETEARYFGAI